MKKIAKKGLVSFILIFLLVTLIYVCDINNLPSNVILFEGETLKLNTIFGIKIETVSTSNPNIESIENNETVTVAADVEDIEEIECTGTINLDVKFLGLTVKEISVSIIEDIEVVPIGGVIGVKLYTNGVLVVGMSEISGTDNNKYKPYEDSGIEEGDVIVQVNDQEITCTSELTNEINKSNGNDMEIKYIRDRRSFHIYFKGSKNK